MRRLILVLLLLPLLLGQSYNVPFNPPAAGGPDPCAGLFQASDDFNRADGPGLGANWNAASGNWAIDAGSTYAWLDGVTGAAIWATATDSISQWACVQKTLEPNGYSGPKFRVSATDDSGNSYVVRWNQQTAAVFRECVGTSCNDVNTSSAAVTITNGDWLCADVRYAGADTEAAVWDMGSSAPGARSTWGDADACWCQSGTCAHPDCTTAAKVSGEPGAGNYADCGTPSSCYVGLYSGAALDSGYDNFSAGVDGCD